ncbi:LuxR C-terminal-related transcriptional regulator [Spirillospora sp. NPDC127200]
MSASVEDTANRLLKGVISDELLSSYIKLLADNGCSQTEASALLGGHDQVTALTESGLAHITSTGPALPPRLVPVRPDLALQGTLATLTRQLVTEHERLLMGQRRMAETHLSPGLTADGSMDRLVQVITDGEEISNFSRAMISTARHDWMTLDNGAVERPMDELTAVPPPPSFAGHVRCRAIYEIACAEHPVGVETIRAAVKAGEQARLLPRIGMKMKIADEAIALLPLTPTGLSGALLIRSAVVVGALREYFELLWERAIPFGAVRPESPLTEVQMTVLNLLAQGMADESIARRIGIGLTTVRRHVSTIREELGVETRFAAGAAAVRRGWIE